MSIKPQKNQTFSTHTLNPYHLLESALPYIDLVEAPHLIQDIQNCLRTEGDAVLLWAEEVVPYLDSIAPPNTHFGATEGNDSDFGWWEYNEDLT